MLPNILMIVGGVVWLIGELIGVFTHGDTTSGWTRWVESRFPIARVFVGVFVLSLFGHLLWGWWLLP